MHRAAVDHMGWKSSRPAIPRQLCVQIELKVKISAKAYHVPPVDRLRSGLQGGDGRDG